MRRDKKLPIILRLKPSGIHGIGVFTDHLIPKKTDIHNLLFEKNDYKFWWASETDKRTIKLLQRYGIKDGKLGYHGPTYLNRMSVGWFLNHSDNPNASRLDKKWRYYALRDIKPGEEITIDYQTLKSN